MTIGDAPVTERRYYERRSAMNRRNYRKHLVIGLRDRIDREKSPSKLVLLWEWLIDASGLPE